MKNADKIGQGYWMASDGRLSTTSIGAVWSDPNATSEELIAAASESRLGTITRLEWHEYVKVGRKVCFEKTKEIHV